MPNSQPTASPQSPNPSKSATSSIRLNKFLAERLGLSRREADNLISQGQVTVNGQPATLGNRIDKNDEVCYNKKRVPYAVAYSYYAFHKPVGYVCSRNPQSKDPTIYQLLPPALKNYKNVGRLDKMSSGLLLLTNDGDFAFQMTHPRFAKQKIYEVTLHRPLTEADRQTITTQGVEIGDGLSKFAVAYHPSPSQSDTPHRQRRNLKNQPDHLHLIVTLSEGRNRQIRRTFAALGYHVLRLHRTKFGPYELGDLRPGDYLEIQK